MGSKIKHEIKSLTYHEVGMKMDNALEAAEKEATKFKGGQEALVEAAKRIEELTSHADKDARDEVFDLEALKHVKRYLIRATEVVKSLALQAEVSSFIAQGKAQGCKHAVTVLKGLFDTERQALALIEAAEKEIADATAAKEGQEPMGAEEPTEREAPKSRFPGMRPSNDIAERREEARREKEAAAKAAEAQTEPAPSEPVAQEAIASTAAEPAESVDPPSVEDPPAEAIPPEVKADEEIALEDFFGPAEVTPPPAPEPKPRKGRKKAA